MSRLTSLSDAITVDEIGIEIGHYGGFFLKSAYQPIYRREGNLLVPFAVEGLTQPFVEGKPVPTPLLFDVAPSEDRTFIENLCRTLHLRNYSNIGVEGLQLFCNFDPGAYGDIGVAVVEVRAMVKNLPELGLDGHLLVCEIADQALNSDKLMRLATEMRRHGMRLAIDNFGSGDSDIERVELIRPDVVKIDGCWFQKVSEVAETVALLPALVAGFKERGIAVLAEGIASAWHLRIALEAGIDFLQGDLLGKPALAGTIFNEMPLSVGDLTRTPDNVVLLRR